MKNIVYRTDQLASIFTRNRIAWDQFYESERVIIDRLGLVPDHQVLDIGCGCAGLGLALRERYGIEHYTGVEINSTAAEAGRRLNPDATILCGDILDLDQGALQDRHFDVVFSLSCVDWNVQYSEMLSVAWSHVREGGHLVSTFRLAVDEGCNDLGRSYQFINADGRLEGERAAYVVLNAGQLLRDLSGFNPSEINSFGYWGAPSATAVTPYQELCFAAFAVRKRRAADVGALRLRMDLPKEILHALNTVSQ